MAAQSRNPLRGVMEESPRGQRRPFQLVGEVFSELTKVTWPTREETYRLSVMVVSLAVTIGLILWFWDTLFDLVVRQFLV